jgi:hypothetical protein
MSQLRELLEPFDRRVIKKVDKGFGPINFVSWTDKIQRLIMVCNDYDWTIRQVVASGDTTEPVGVIGTLTLTVDENTSSRDGAGTGQDLKKAETDALARAMAKFGLGLHLWTQGGDRDGGYWITSVLDRQDDES